MKDKLIIATRKSELALWQANHVAGLLRKLHAGLEVELLPMVTQGDIILDRPLAQIGGKGLSELGWMAQMLMVYRRENAALDKQEINRLKEAGAILSVWTSANAMKSLSQRLPPAAWFRLCQGEWLVISDRLKRLARAYGPNEIHLSPGPGNSDLFSAIRGLI